MREKIYKMIKRFGMVSSGDHLLVAFSGGPDSMALLHFLYFERQALDIQVSAAHLNHRWRGVDSDRDQRQVEEVCSRLTIPLYTERLPDNFCGNTNPINSETRAREVRHTFLHGVAEQIGATKIAMGHTADDNVETFLMSLMRGAGIEGLCGIPPTRGEIIRPFIGVSREEIMTYCSGHQLAPCVDQTNQELHTQRNWIRHKLIPLLEAESPKVRQHIEQTIDVVQEEIESFQKLFEEYRSQVEVVRSEDRQVFSWPAMMTLPRALQRRMIRMGLEGLGCSLQDVGFRHTEQIVEGIQNGVSLTRDLPGGIRIEKDGEHIAMFRVRPTRIRV